MRTSRRKPPIEELSPEAWQRVEERVFARLDDQVDESLVSPQDLALGSRVTTWLAATALVASVVAIVVASWPQAPGVSHAPDETGASDAPARAAAVDPADDGARETSASLGVPAPTAPSGPRIMTTTGPTTTHLGESTLSIGDHSRLRVEGDDEHGWLVRLDAGRVHFDVAPRGRRPEFVVRAGELVVRVVGTHFDVSLGSDETRVVVQEGQVRVESGGTTALLGAGESWPKPPERAPAASGDRERRPRPGRSPRQEFERAAQLERTDPKGARAIYRRLARAHGPWAANALFAEARLLLDEGRRRQARSLLGRYLERYPRGANAPDARKLLSSDTDVDEPGQR